MKKIIFIILTFLCVLTANAQNKFRQADIDGIWLTTEAFDENTQRWIPYGGDDAQALAFTSTKSNDKYIALLSNNGGMSTFVYTINNNKILMRDIEDHSNVLVAIKILSFKRGQSFIGEISTKSSPYSAKFKFSKIDEKE